jgi:hypothetical protein
VHQRNRLDKSREIVVKHSHRICRCSVRRTASCRRALRLLEDEAVVSSVIREIDGAPEESLGL